MSSSFLPQMLHTSPILLSLQSTASKYKIINLIGGIVIGFTRPKENSFGATDKYSASYAITDLSLNDFDTNRHFFVTLILFGDDIDQFPPIIGAGNMLTCSFVKVQYYKRTIQLTANLKKSSFKVMYEKIDFFTGYRPSHDDITVDEELQMKLNETVRSVVLDIISNRLNSTNMNISSVITVLKSPPYILFDYNPLRPATESSASQQLIKPEIEFVKAKLDWANYMLLNTSITNFNPLPAEMTQSLETLQSISIVTAIADLLRTDSICSNSLISSNRPHQSPIARIDMICIIVQLILPSNNPNQTSSCPELIVWDGSGDGFLSANVYTSTYNASNASHIFNQIYNSFTAASTYTKASLPDVNNIYSYYSDITDSKFVSGASCKTVSLAGNPVSLRVTDTSILPYLTTLKPGTWIRIRNVYIRPNLHSPSQFSRLHIVHIGDIHADTHIIPLYPYFK